MVKPVPIRIQIWIDGDTSLDMRAWLDHFEASSSPDARYHTFELKAHNDWYDAPWKFERGKPKVVA